MSVISMASSNLSSSSSGSMVFCSDSISMVFCSDSISMLLSSSSSGSTIGLAGFRTVYSKGSGSVTSDPSFTVNFGSSSFPSASHLIS